MKNETKKYILSMIVQKALGNKIACRFPFVILFISRPSSFRNVKNAHAMKLTEQSANTTKFSKELNISKEIRTNRFLR